MEYFASLYYFYTQPIVKTFRVIGMVVLTLGILFTYQHLPQAKFVLFILSLFLMNEIFIIFSIARKIPTKKVHESSATPTESFTLEATESMLAPSVQTTITRLIGFPQIQFFLEKAGISFADIQYVEVDKKTFLSESLNMAKTMNGIYVTTIDLFVTYLLLSEDVTKLLFTKKLKKDDVMHIAYWTRLHFASEEREKITRVTFWGEGIGQSFISGWTVETKKFTQDFSSMVVNKHPLVTQRQKEYTQLLETLSKKENNNVILAGEVGAGKESLVEALAVNSFMGSLSPALNFKRLLELLVGTLLAGVMTKGELQERLETILQEVSHAGDIILYIPEFQNILGSSSFGMDISDVLVPYLRNGKMPIIGTMTASNYKQFMERNTLREMFEVISLSEPDKKQAMQMLLEKVFEIEEKYQVSISYAAVVSAVDLAGKYVLDTVLPGNAVILLEDVANMAVNKKKKLVTSDDVIEKVENKTNIHVGVPKKEEKDLLLHLEEKMHQRVIGQDGAISAVAEALRRLRAGIATSNKPISFLFLGPTGVGKTETAKALASLYFGREESMLRFDMSEYSDATAVMKLLGTPGTFQRGELTEAVHDNPFSLILFDEFEKANPEVLNLFLQILEDGRLTDSQGKTVSFANAVIIATSNAASELIREAVAQGTKIDTSFQSKLLEYLQQQAVFKPELLNRFDGIVAFKSLADSEVKQVAELLLKETVAKLDKQDITLAFDTSLVDFIARQGYDPSFGARPLRRFIQDKIEDTLARKMLEGTLQRGAKARVSVDPSGQIIVG